MPAVLTPEAERLAWRPSREKFHLAGQVIEAQLLDRSLYKRWPFIRLRNDLRLPQGRLRWRAESRRRAPRTRSAGGRNRSVNPHSEPSATGEQLDAGPDLLGCSWPSDHGKKCTAEFSSAQLFPSTEIRVGHFGKLNPATLWVRIGELGPGHRSQFEARRSAPCGAVRSRRLGCPGSRGAGIIGRVPHDCPARRSTCTASDNDAARLNRRSSSTASSLAPKAQS